MVNVSIQYEEVTLKNRCASTMEINKILNISILKGRDILQFRNSGRPYHPFLVTGRLLRYENQAQQMAKPDLLTIGPNPGYLA